MDSEQKKKKKKKKNSYKNYTVVNINVHWTLSSKLLWENNRTGWHAVKINQSTNICIYYAVEGSGNWKLITGCREMWLL